VEEARRSPPAKFATARTSVDVCLQSSDRDEIRDIPLFYDRLIRKIKAPIMIDTPIQNRWSYR